MNFHIHEIAETFDEIHWNDSEFLFKLAVRVAVQKVGYVDDVEVDINSAYETGVKITVKGERRFDYVIYDIPEGERVHRHCGGGVVPLKAFSVDPIERCDAINCHNYYLTRYEEDRFCKYHESRGVMIDPDEWTRLKEIETNWTEFVEAKKDFNHALYDG